MSLTRRRFLILLAAVALPATMAATDRGAWPSRGLFPSPDLYPMAGG